jgi:hypothetical protein
MRDFLAAESGAVTADFTVLTAGVVGLGLAVMGAITPGISGLSTTIADLLRGVDVRTGFGEVFARNDFSDGRGAWVGGEVREIEGFGKLLALSATSRSASLDMDVGDWDYAVAEFDMVVGDSWDDENGTITIAGQDIVTANYNWQGADDEPTITIHDSDSDTTVELTRTTHQSGANRWRSGGDHVYAVRVTTANDGRNLNLTASTDLSSGSNDEFFGIDNVVVRGSD